MLDKTGLPRRSLEALLVLLGLVLLSAAIRRFGLDIAVSRWFYDPNLDPSWWAKGRQPWEFLYRYGALPAILAGALGLFGMVGSLFARGLRRHRRAGALLFLTLAIGPGLFVNAVGKEHWGRPRPREIVEFGGRESFLPVGAVEWNAEGESFPSGHASVGFYFFALHFLWRGRRPRAATAGLAAGLGGGALMGFQRVAVGAHFLSDVVWSGGIVYLTALLIERGIEAAVATRERPDPPRR